MIFICYAHEDKQWLDRLLGHLAPLRRQSAIAAWSDQDLKSGDRWHDEIAAQLETATVAVLLVSRAFLASEYIANSELPVLLRRAHDSSGVTLIPVLVSPSIFAKAVFRYPDPLRGPDTFSLASIQAANSPTETLAELSYPAQERALVALAERLLDLEGARAGAPTVSTGQLAPGSLHQVGRMPTTSPAERSRAESVSAAAVDDLIDEEAESTLVLLASECGGVLVIMSNDQMGPYVAVGMGPIHSFAADPREIATYRAALEALAAKGLIAREERRMYRLTAKGYAEADRLARAGRRPSVDHTPVALDTGHVVIRLREPEGGLDQVAECSLRLHSTEGEFRVRLSLTGTAASSLGNRLGVAVDRPGDGGALRERIERFYRRYVQDNAQRLAMDAYAKAKDGRVPRAEQVFHDVDQLMAELRRVPPVDDTGRRIPHYIVRPGVSPDQFDASPDGYELSADEVIALFSDTEVTDAGGKPQGRPPKSQNVARVVLTQQGYVVEWRGGMYSIVKRRS